VPVFDSQSMDIHASHLMTPPTISISLSGNFGAEQIQVVSLQASLRRTEQCRALRIRITHGK